ncbi:MAG: protein-L-isoaspartate(D-aspartate) O-methyltransferase [Hyphomicrobium sp.]|uniref:protein-L-isoaspartate(D-aspartate) O-methyltransferase n=1 Tax=Hyphomicrobium sp. TaxID=82 RepID=UPI001323F422|nr:protein-L-isoaspartate(D-aspartate) O-methyltransferase [Hyphomicrobium sp.]KAB2942359.1 MAG: protein-L-isoaspartate(D-aspartate) O-methyltransferase [Hyphomicrobium sp.]MBZ0212129.1 protein-L-isoaspartate(D-aspartate) O-methyltransferase [Hyphomicrobium sp.]
MSDFAEQRQYMVKHHIAARGVRSPLVLDAMGSVPREQFLPSHLRDYAYEDTPLPIGEEQTISQPYIVAFMTEALGLSGGEKVLEIGAGSGYAAAILSRIASEVYTVERIGELAAKASEKLADLGYDNVHVLHADGTRGWPEHAPYDAIIVAAGGPDVPRSLKQQLRVGGRLVIPVGTNPRAQELVRLTRVSEDEYKTEDIADVRFVPLLGEEGWAEEAPAPRRARRALVRDGGVDGALVKALAAEAEPFGYIEDADLDPLLRRIGEARVVLIGEATHGTSEFYRLRERITRALIEKTGFNFVAIEGDWPDAARIDHYVRHFEFPASEWTAFARFPTWMWRNAEVRAFVDWLREHNRGMEPGKRVAFHGLDLYSLHNSIRSVLDYLDEVDPTSAKIARERYGCLTPWQADPATYGRAALTGGYRTCENEVALMLAGILSRQREYALRDGERYLDAVQNARLVASAERYYRVMYYGSRASWNLRDQHMFDTLKTLLAYYGPHSKAVVWAHNSHVGDASATEMSSRGEHNIGQLCRREFERRAYLIGFGTDSGTVAAASDWDAPMQVMSVRPSLPKSHERQCHAVTETTGEEHFMLRMGANLPVGLRDHLAFPRIERAIGVIYRPETELASHYFQAVLPLQFDEYIWLDKTEAVTPFATRDLEGMPDTYPFGL